MFAQDSELRLIKEKRAHDILFVIDMTAHSAIDYAQREGLNFVIVNILPSVIFNQNIPQFIARFPFTTTSFTKLTSIYQEEGISKYLLTRLYEEIYIQGRLLLQGIKSVGELNSIRRAHNMSEKYEILFTSSEKIFIHFTSPGVLDYSYPIAHNNRFVGYKSTAKKNHKLIGKPNLFSDKLGEENFVLYEKNKDDNLSDQEMTRWLDEKLERNISIVYIAFGTKLEFSNEHMTTILNFTIRTDENIHVICVHEGYSDLKLPESMAKKVLFQTWVNQGLILSHPSIVAFVTHAGCHSLVEAIDNQVPVLTFPIFGDQFANSIRCEDFGLGFVISEDIFERNEKSFSKSLKSVISSKMEIKKRMREIKRNNLNAAKLSISTIQSLGDSLSNISELLSNNVLTAGEIVIEVAFDNFDRHTRDISTLLPWYIQLNIPLLFILSLLIPLLSITFQYCCFLTTRRRNSNKQL